MSKISDKIIEIEQMYLAGRPVDVIVRTAQVPLEWVQQVIREVDLAEYGEESGFQINTPFNFRIAP